MHIAPTAIATYAVVQNFGYASLQVWLLRRRQPWPRWLGVAIFLWVLAMSVMFVLDIFQPWKSFMR
ncbi:MAG: hypothetical protein LV480_07010, partial [Methylacidiphilales bacterium]|nr:hypothetical protein [Candidatus Methylacidiphilales bacterium]